MQPTELAPGYELKALIGCGAGGMVFRARQEALDRDVALKTINPTALSSNTSEPRIQREARAIAKLRHPGIVTAYDSGFYNGRFCIAMELVEGETLVDFVQRESPVPQFVAWSIVRQVAAALAHACEAGIIHRDIKPANLLLCQPGQGTSVPTGVPFVKVADFGLAIDDQANQITATGATLGTPAYVAPEQLQDPHVDQRADIYSLGATVFEMFVGRPPCVDQSPMKTIMQKTIGDDRWRDELPKWVSTDTRKLFFEMTETNVENRIPDYSTLIDRIDDLLIQLAPRTTSPLDQNNRSSFPHRTHSRESQNRTLKAFVVLGVGALLTTLFLAAWKAPQSAPKTSTDQVWVSDGIPRPLFNGKSVPLFPQSGVWSPGTIEDGSRVLQGVAGSRMTIPLSVKDTSPQDVRLRLSINLAEPSKAEIAIDAAGKEQAPTLIAFSPDRVQFVVSNEASEKPDVILLLQSNELSSTFHNVTISKRNEQVVVTVNGQRLGSIQCRRTDSVNVGLFCISGPVNFADIDLVPIKPQTDVQ